MQKFYEANKRSYLESSESINEDNKKIVEIKNSLLEQYKIDSSFISDDLFNEYLN